MKNNADFGFIFVGKLRPQVVLLSAGQSSQPDPETLQAVEGYTLLRTDCNGWIELSTDGERLWANGFFSLASI